MKDSPERAALRRRLFMKVAGLCASILLITIGCIAPIAFAKSLPLEIRAWIALFVLLLLIPICVLGKSVVGNILIEYRAYNMYSELPEEQRKKIRIIA